MVVQNKVSRVLFGIETFYPEHKAGTESYALNLARELRSHGITVEFLTPSLGDSFSSYEFDGFKIRQFQTSQRISSKELNGLVPPVSLAGMLKEVKKIAPDVFHLHSLTRSFNGVHLKGVNSLGIPTVLTPHLAGNFCVCGDLRLYGTETCDGRVRPHRCLVCYARKQGFSAIASNAIGVVGWASRVNSFLSGISPASLQVANFRVNEMRRVARYTDMVVALSPWIEELVRSNGIDRVCTVRQAVAGEFLEFSSKVPKEKAKSVAVVGFVGRTHPIKGLHWFLESAEALRNEAVEFHIISNPSSEIEYARAQQNKADNLANVKWEENLSPLEVRNRMMSWDVLCVPSASEMAPLVIKEAAACNLPVVGSNIPSIEDMVIDGENGALFPVGDVPALVKALQQLLSDTRRLSLLSGAADRPRTFVNVAEDMLAVYNSL
jgi:glycosyltransferase involved in cell wall biosynthesis